MLKKLIAGQDFSPQVLRQMLGDINYNFQLWWSGRWGASSSAGTGTTNVSLDGPLTIVLANSVAGNVTLALPTASGIAGKQVWVKKMSALNSVVIDPFGSETIDGSATKTLTTLNEVVRLVSDGVNWQLF